MEYVSLGLSLVALVIAVSARATASGLKQRIEDQGADARRRIENAGEQTERALALNRRLLARVAAGERLEREMVLEGRLWREVTHAEAKRMVEQGELRLLDVRSPQETASGVVPGALLIPIDELPSRLSEVSRADGDTLVYCSGGGRSAAACELLSQEGFEGMLNLEGGLSGWTGPMSQPGK